MKTTPHENPELTAYALGELHAYQAGEIHELLASCPVATHDLEQIEAVTDALRQGAPIPQDRLRPEQRHAVLRPTHLPRRVTPLLPRPMAKKPTRAWPMVTGVLKAAAVVTVAGMAYQMGRHSEILPSVVHVPEIPHRISPVAPKITPEPVKPALVSELKPALQIVAVPQDLPAVTAPEKPAVTVIVPEPVIVKAPEPASKEKAMEIAAPIKPAAPAPIYAQTITTPAKSLAFVSANRQPVDEFALRPANIRPAPVKPAKADLMASPAPLKQAPEIKDTSKPKRPDVYIHSWKAEITSCPWNDAHRLLRVTVLLPADQPAAMSTATYPLRVTFDPNNVREYRQLCERHQAATEVRESGKHVIWYEFQPNGSTDISKTVATVTLADGRFTTQTVGPFDASKLSIQDRGQSWQTAREDFVFETSVVGFGLLLRGEAAAPALDHQLVLNLAEKSKGADASGERARFIRLVQEAKKAAGF